jgi:hypothetical protein
MTAPKRRWFRFSLGTMFVVVTTCGGLLTFALWAISPEVKQVSFDSAAWQRADPIERSRTVRSQMIVDLLRTHNFQGWPRERVVQLLGTPDWTAGEAARAGFRQFDMVYRLGLERGGSFSLDTEALGFNFDANGRVVKYGCSVN